MSNKFVAHKGLKTLQDSEITGSLSVTGGITGSLFGSASYAIDTTLSTGNTITQVRGTTKAITSSMYTLIPSDTGKIITFNNSSSIAVTVPSGLDSGFSATFIQKGSGSISLSGSGTTIINRQSHTGSAGIGAVVGLYSDVSDNFYFTGDTA